MAKKTLKNSEQRRRVWARLERRYEVLRCIYCGEYEESELSIDHVIPVSKGGTNHLDNLTVACKTCNNKRGNLPFFYFREMQVQIKSRSTKQPPRNSLYIDLEASN